MNQNQFNELTEKLLTACTDALGMKAGEYAREGDRLHNFYAAARKRNQHPLDSLLGMQVKHRVSIDDICEDIVKHGKFPTVEMMLEKFKDDINYNLLAFALIHELREKAWKGGFAKGGIPAPSWNCRCVVEVQSTTPKHSIDYVSALEAALHPNWEKRIEYEQCKYLPVPEINLGNCYGCYFSEDNNTECKKFRSYQGITANDFCDSGVIWLKVV